MLGVVKLHKALEIAESAGLDLVEVSPNAKPPVCKILDHGKFKFEAQKKAAKAGKKQKVIDIKEVKYRPNIDTNDFNIKTKNVKSHTINADLLISCCGVAKLVENDWIKQDAIIIDVGIAVATVITIGITIAVAILTVITCRLL